MAARTEDADQILRRRPLGGTHRMGTDRSNSVVDDMQRSWDHDNLYLVGCGSFPTVATANPTLTMAALALRTADHIVKNFPH